MTMLNIGDKAPSFTLPDQTGVNRSLSDWSEEWLLLYFYPQDDTPGCTTEACGLRDNLMVFNELHAAVVGVSADSVTSHAKFVEKYHLPFTLLSDADKTVCNAYGTAGLLGVKRTSFLIDPGGNIAKIYENVKPGDHAAQVIADIKALL